MAWSREGPVVVDANILFAALIRDSTTRRLLFDSTLDFVTPAAIWDEWAAHEGDLSRRKDLDADATRALVERLGQRIRTLPDEAVLRHVRAARRLVEAIDPKDVAYVAATLAVGGVLWTHDRHLGAAVPVVTTRDLREMGER